MGYANIVKILGVDDGFVLQEEAFHCFELKPDVRGTAHIG